MVQKEAAQFAVHPHSNNHAAGAGGGRQWRGYGRKEGRRKRKSSNSFWEMNIYSNLDLFGFM
jgi:hypothetical protein